MNDTKAKKTMWKQINFLKRLATKKVEIPRIIPLAVLVFVIELLASFPVPIFFFIPGFFACRAFFRNGSKYVKVYFILILAFIVIYQIRYRIDIYNGNKIVAAIESYHQTNNSYPEKLKNLVPEHIDSIPFNWMGYYTWVYHKHDDDYMLLFVPYGMMKCSYNKNDKDWVCFD